MMVLCEGFKHDVKKSSSDCIFRLKLLCLALVMFAPLIACSIAAATLLQLEERSRGAPEPPSLVFLTVVCVAPVGLYFGVALVALAMYICSLVVVALFSVLLACISPAAFRDGAHAHNEVVVGGNVYDCESGGPLPVAETVVTAELAVAGSRPQKACRGSS
jgi:hypothetical protein